MALAEGCLQAVKELTAEQFGEGADRDEEVVLCRDPARVVSVEPAGGDYDMQVDVGVEILVPGVKYCGEAGLGLEPWPALSQLEQSLGGSLEEEVVQEPRVLKHEEVEFVREGEDHMKISGGQEFF
jgi:hypothetical protein